MDGLPKRAFSFEKSIAAATTDDVKRIMPFKGRVVRIVFRIPPVSSDFQQIKVAVGPSDLFADNTQIFPEAVPGSANVITGQNYNEDVPLSYDFEPNDRIIVQSTNPDAADVRTMKVLVIVEKLSTIRAM